jgi:uncharacterized membrane protein
MKASAPEITPRNSVRATSGHAEPHAPTTTWPALKRPFVVVGLAVGVALYFGLAPWIARPVARALIAWDGCILALLALTYAYVASRGGKDTARRIAELKASGSRLLVFAVLASVLSIAGLASEAAGAKAEHGSLFAVVLSVTTIVLSWFLIQILFALRYAHEFFSSRDGKEQNGGLNFGEPGEPDFHDFIHFSVVLGAAAQTADITFTSRPMRRIGTVHTLVAFGFNTAILATLINVLLSTLPGS